MTDFLPETRWQGISYERVHVDDLSWRFVRFQLVIAMPDLSGQQTETLRSGLEQRFSDMRQFRIFLWEKLEKHLTHYAADTDPIPIAYFRVLLGAEAEGWVTDLVKASYAEGRHNRQIAKVAAELGLISAPITPTGTGAVFDEPAPPLWRTFNPYRGLLALRAQDADFLFGRDEDVDRFIDAIATDQSKILLVLGASGVGKSSLMFAGVLGALNRRVLKSRKQWPIALEDSHNWSHLVLTPGTEPVRSLSGAFVREWIDPTTPQYRQITNDWRSLLVQGDGLGGLVDAADEARQRKQEDPPSRYLIYVDQGEELYTRGGREPGQDRSDKETPKQSEARRFSELLVEAAAHPRLIVLMSARSDFLGQLQADKKTSDNRAQKIFDAHQKLDISPLSEHGLAQVVCRPAELLMD